MVGIIALEYGSGIIRGYCYWRAVIKGALSVPSVVVVDKESIRPLKTCATYV